MQVSILPNCRNDQRTIDKLTNQVNEHFDDFNMWLTPFVNPAFEERIETNSYQFKHNTIFIHFDETIIISAINFWNYTKTPKRGAREIEIFLDEALLYRVKKIIYKKRIILIKNFLKKINKILKNSKKKIFIK